MGIEINLMENYPKTKRDPEARGAEKTDEDRAIARKFGKEFFDGERKHGYGGYHYDGRWKPIAKKMIDHYKLNNHWR